MSDRHRSHSNGGYSFSNHHPSHDNRASSPPRYPPSSGGPARPPPPPPAGQHYGAPPGHSNGGYSHGYGGGGGSSRDGQGGPPQQQQYGGGGQYGHAQHGGYDRGSQGGHGGGGGGGWGAQRGGHHGGGGGGGGHNGGGSLSGGPSGGHNGGYGGGGRGGRGGPGGGRGGYGGGGRGGSGGGGGGGGRNGRALPPVFVPLPNAVPALPAKQTGALVPEPVARRAYGSAGGAVKLVTNTFDLKLSDNQTTWYKYEIVITVNARPRADGSVPPPRGPPPKSVLRAVWSSLEENEKAGRSNYLDGVQPAYDGRNALYTSRTLKMDKGRIWIPKYAAPDRPGQTFTIVIHNGVKIPLVSVRSYFTGGPGATYNVGELSEAMQALNVVIGHKPASLFYATRTAFFVGDEAATSLNMLGVEKKSVTVAPDFVELWRGYFESVRACAGGLLMNLNTTSTAFYKAGDLSAFLRGFFLAKGSREPPGFPRVGSLAGSDLIKVNRLLQKLIVVADRGSTVPALKIKIRGAGIVNKAPRDHLFETENGPLSVEQYFADKFKVRLRNPDWPLVEVKPGALYPLELVRLVEGNKYAKRLSPQEQNLASSFQTLVPAEKFGAIMAARKNIVARVSEPFMTIFGLSLDPDPKETVGRILPPPRIEYKAGPDRSRFTSVTPVDSAWMMQFAQGSFAQTFVASGKLSSIMVIVESERDRRAAVTFFEELLPKMRALGIDLSGFPNLRQGVLDRVVLVRNRRTVADEVLRAMNEGDEIFGRCPDLIVWVFTQANSEDYPSFKYECTRRGIASQALQSKLIAKLSVQVAVNVAMKLNSKLHGYAFRLERNTLGGWIETHAPMLFGIDLSHEIDKPSVAAMVASMHGAAIVMEETCSIQGLAEPPQGNPLGRARKQEIVVDTCKMATTLLRRRVLSLRQAPPNSLLVFRDGVSESEFQSVLSYEVPAFKEACRIIKADKELESVLEKARGQGGKEELRAWNPKIVFVAALKRHSIRAFVPNASDPRNTSNILPGTVLDRDVVDPHAADFYAASHSALIGTTRATRYTCLVDEVGMSPDELQATVHALSHSFQRCNRAVSVVAPVFYADLIAAQVRSWIIGDSSDAGSSTGTAAAASASTRRADLVGAQQILASTENGRDAFRGDFDARRPPAAWWM
ncbi:hypothetical protein JCM3775_006714 [Rhodotorula graminis]